MIQYQRPKWFIKSRLSNKGRRSRHLNHFKIKSANTKCRLAPEEKTSSIQRRFAHHTPKRGKILAWKGNQEGKVNSPFRTSSTPAHLSHEGCHLLECWFRKNGSLCRNSKTVYVDWDGNIKEIVDQYPCYAGSSLFIKYKNRACSIVHVTNYGTVKVGSLLEMRTKPNFVTITFLALR